MIWSHVSLNSIQPDTESEFWKTLGSRSWKRLYGDLQTDGFALEWHDFRVTQPVVWSESFRPGTLEICLNQSGEATVRTRMCELRFRRSTIGYFRVGAGDSHQKRGEALRKADQRHQFLTISFTLDYLRDQLTAEKHSLNPGVQRTIFDTEPEPKSAVNLDLNARPMRESDLMFTKSLLTPPLNEAAHAFFYRGKILELMSMLFFSDGEREKDFFCFRQKQVASDRVRGVCAILAENLDSPPSLEQLGKRIGCSHFYLSRVFSETTGMTITQYLRKLRIEKAAELLVSGRFNVGEAAIEVGYNSLSHFSKAFKEVKGCYPSDYQ